MSSRHVVRRVAAVASLILIAVAGAALAQDAEDEPSDKGKVRYHYEPPENKDFAPILRDLQSAKFLEEVADSLNKTYKLPVDLTLIAGECGTVNAFYDPTQHRVILCYEFLALWQALLAKEAAENGDHDRQAIKTSLRGDALFVMYHEVGHALIDLLQLPSTGREEDAVDQLATVVLVGEDDDAGTDAALDAAHSWVLLDEERTREGKEGSTWDVHSLDLQRFYNITCWVYGSDPETFADFVKDGDLPKERAEGCAEEWAKTSQAWATLLAPYLKDQPAAE